MTALPSAVAANSTIASVSRLVGPALGGAMVAITGVASCFYANAVSYVVVFVALASISRQPARPAADRRREPAAICERPSPTCGTVPMSAVRSSSWQSSGWSPSTSRPRSPRWCGSGSIAGPVPSGPR